MPWLSICIETDCHHADALADALLESGALSASIEDADAGTERETPQFGEPGSVTTPGWERSRVVALLAEGTDPDELLAACAARPAASSVKTRPRLRRAMAAVRNCKAGLNPLSQDQPLL